MNRELTQINIERLEQDIDSYYQTIKDIQNNAKKKIKLLKLAIKDKEKEIKYNKALSKM